MDDEDSLAVPLASGWLSVHPRIAGLGWSTRRFGVLDHSILLLYVSEDTFLDHSAPIKDYELSHETRVHASERGDQRVLTLQTRQGNNVLILSADTLDETEKWELSLRRAVRRLIVEARTRPVVTSSFLPPPPSALGVPAPPHKSRSLNPITWLTDWLFEPAEQELLPARPSSPQSALPVTDASTDDVASSAGNRANTNPDDADLDARGRHRTHCWMLQWLAHRSKHRHTDMQGESSAPRSLGLGAWLANKITGGGEHCRNCRCHWCKEEASSRDDGSASPQLRRNQQSCNLSKWSLRGSQRSLMTGSKHGWARVRHAIFSKCSEKDVDPVDPETVSKWLRIVACWYGLNVAREGNVEDVKRFLKRFPDFPDKGNMLRAAVRYKHYHLASYFIEEEGMDVDSTNTSGMPLIWFAVLFQSRSDGGVMVKYLLSQGAKGLTTKNKWGMTVMHLVATARPSQSIPTMQFLHHDFGLQLDARDHFSSTPLHWAVLHGHLETVQWLCDNSCFSKSPISWAADWQAVFTELANLRLIRPEHKGALRNWRVRGLTKFVSSLTPLGVAVLHNHESIARYLMGIGPEHLEGVRRGDYLDMPCSRSKRHALFADGSTDLLLVAKTWPQLLVPVLDVFCATGESEIPRMSERHTTFTLHPGSGWVERKYDVRLLYGLPELPTSRTPLSILLSTGYTPLFDTNIIQLIVSLKWTIFGAHFYIWELFRYGLMVVTWVLGFVIYYEPSSNREDVNLGSVMRWTCWVLTAYNLFIEEGSELLHSHSKRAYFMSGWNIQSLTADFLTLALLPIYLVEESHKADVARRLLTAPAALALMLRSMEFLSIWRPTGIFLAVIRTMIVDTLYWSMLFLMFILSFTMAFFGLLDGEEGFTSFGESFVTTFVMSQGDINLPFSEDQGGIEVMASALLLLFILLCSILFINLLIAILTTSYDSVSKAAEAQALMNRAETLLKWESTMNLSKRRAMYSRVAPPKGRRTHITLRDLFSGSSREVFVDKDEVRVIEPLISKGKIGQEAILARLSVIEALLSSSGTDPKPRPPIHRSSGSFGSGSFNGGRGSGSVSSNSGYMAFRARYGNVTTADDSSQRDKMGSGGWDEVSALIAGGQGKRLSSLRDQMGIVESRITRRSAAVTLQALARGFIARRRRSSSSPEVAVAAPVRPIAVARPSLQGMVGTTTSGRGGGHHRGDSNDRENTICG